MCLLVWDQQFKIFNLSILDAVLVYKRQYCQTFINNVRNAFAVFALNLALFGRVFDWPERFAAENPATKFKPLPYLSSLCKYGLLIAGLYLHIQDIYMRTSIASASINILKGCILFLNIHFLISPTLNHLRYL